VVVIATWTKLTFQDSTFESFLIGRLELTGVYVHAVNTNDSL